MIENQAKIKRNKEEETMYLSLLNLHFETVTYEKYIDSSMNIMFSQARQQVLGKNFNKMRISQRKEKKIKELIIKKMHSKYGKYVSLTHFKIKDINRTIFLTNLDTVFTVPGHGKLYGCYYRQTCGNIFLTQHCLERFEERADPAYCESIMRWIKKTHNAAPTTVDVISSLIMVSNFEYGRTKEHFHLCIGIGVLVIEDFGDVYIAKTFLSPEMFKEKIKWYKPILPADRRHFNSFAEVIHRCESQPIDRPRFIKDYIIEMINKMKKDNIIPGNAIPDAN